jgi:hypothetical protein
VIQITAQMRILVAVEAVDGRKYAPSIVMWSRQLGVVESARFGGSGRRITVSTVWTAALPAACPAGGIGLAERWAEPTMPSSPTFR